jgi:serine/threonine protein kinase/formylglycine-generating enzyme required for sulfatase activity
MAQGEGMALQRVEQMTPERWKQIDQLLETAIGLEPDERADFLDEACADDSALRQRVETLMAALGQAGSFMETPPAEAAESLFASKEGLVVGRSIAHYEIIGKLGAGGMGEVYLALDKGLGRRVALKLLPAHFSQDAERARRFELEARAASALNHPNIMTIYDIGRGGDLQFIAAEYIEGLTLRQRLSGGPMSLGEAIEIVVQVAAALVAAHAAGIVHRDVKPENVMARPDGLVKVLDFGLAKLAERRRDGVESGAPALIQARTDPGRVMGTARYMSPEQARGMEVDARSDIFSLGVMLYEMIAGQAPFEGKTTADLFAAILKVEPAPIERFAPGAPDDLQGIVNRSLRKDRDERYQTIEELFVDLKNLKQRLEIQAELKRAAQTDGKREWQSARTAATARQPKAADTASRRFHARYSPLRIGFILVALIVVVAGLFAYRRNAVLVAARESVPQVKELAGQGKYFDAYDLAVKLGEPLPDDATLAELMHEISDDLSVQTEPAGASVYLKRFALDSTAKIPARELIGTTPISNLRIARGEYVLEVEREGYAPVARTISSALNRVEAILGASPAIRVNLKLIEKRKVPDRMVFVPGSDYSLVGWGQPTQASAKLGDYFIDKFEVTNREFKEFISAGGYLKREFWKYPFVKDGKPLSWEEAMGHFKDGAGLPGPRNWTVGAFPEGEAEHPVTGVSWYEAAAYAEFRGKQLPTVFQWEKAARDGTFTHINALVMPWGLSADLTATYRANMQGRGAVAVDQFEFGISPYGCYNMAGNVTEWAASRWGDNFIALGGSWGDAFYLFANYGKFPGLYSSDKIGFRCVLNTSAERGSVNFTDDEERPIYTPTSAASVKAWLSHYRYDKTPLDAQIIEKLETDEYSREKITYAGANDERAIAYLYLPKNAQKPYQVINFIPSGVCSAGFPPTKGLDFSFFSPHVKLGRAVLVSVYKGCPERPWPAEQRPADRKSVKYRDTIVSFAIDVRRGLDYLETRAEIDAGKIALMNLSTSTRGLILGAVEARYRSAVFLGYGVYKFQLDNIPEANPINFASHIRMPKLILNGRYDEDFPFKATAEPLYRLLREPKMLELYDGGHIPPLEVSVPVINRWLDETLGAVRYK